MVEPSGKLTPISKRLLIGATVALQAVALLALAGWVVLFAASRGGAPTDAVEVKWSAGANVYSLVSDATRVSCGRFVPTVPAPFNGERTPLAFEQWLSAIAPPAREWDIAVLRLSSGATARLGSVQPSERYPLPLALKHYARFREVSAPHWSAGLGLLMLNGVALLLCARSRTASKPQRTAAAA
jgi:hypothetical protein